MGLELWSSEFSTYSVYVRQLANAWTLLAYTIDEALEYINDFLELANIN